MGVLHRGQVMVPVATLGAHWRRWRWCVLPYPRWVVVPGLGIGECGVVCECAHLWDGDGQGYGLCCAVFGEVCVESVSAAFVGELFEEECCHAEFGYWQAHGGLVACG